jgi:hypothetical protein
MNILIIDSTAHGFNDKNSSLHVRNSFILKDYLGADLIPSDPSYLNDIRHKTYDKILYVYASGHIEISYFRDFLLENHESNSNGVDYFYVCNDYNVGEPVLAWLLSYKYGINYSVIANHTADGNKKLKTDTQQERIINWDMVNINCLIYNPVPQRHKSISAFFQTVDNRSDIIYFGAFRKGRLKYFNKYFHKDFPVSTSRKNIKLYQKNGIFPLWHPLINWNDSLNTLHNYKSSLYIEDEATHKDYSCLGNRYYEALSYDIPTFFDSSCMNTIEKSGYDIDDFFIVDSIEELNDKLKQLDSIKIDLTDQKEMARKEKEDTLKRIKEIILS